MSDHKKLLQANYDDSYQFLVEKGLKPREEDGERKGHTHGDELSKLRKEIAHIEEVLSIQPTPEFHAYYLECEAVKQAAKEIIEDE